MCVCDSVRKSYINVKHVFFSAGYMAHTEVQYQWVLSGWQGHALVCRMYTSYHFYFYFLSANIVQKISRDLGKIFKLI